MKYDQPNDIWADAFVCPSHTSAVPGQEDYRFDPNCEGCQKEVASRTAVIDQMQAEGVKIASSMARHGGQAPISDMMAAARVEVLIDTFLHDPRQRMKFEGEVGRRIILTLRNMEQQFNRARLTAPVLRHDRIEYPKPKGN